MLQDDNYRAAGDMVLAAAVYRTPRGHQATVQPHSTLVTRKLRIRDAEVDHNCNRYTLWTRSPSNGLLNFSCSGDVALAANL